MNLPVFDINYSALDIVHQLPKLELFYNKRHHSTQLLLSHFFRNFLILSPNVVISIHLSSMSFVRAFFNHNKYIIMQTKREPDISSKFDDADPLFIDQYLLFFHLMTWWQPHFSGPFLHNRILCLHLCWNIIAFLQKCTCRLSIWFISSCFHSL